MAWITSATSRIVMAKSHLRILQICLITTQLSLLVLLLRGRTGPSPQSVILADLAGDPADFGAVPALSGLSLLLLLTLFVARSLEDGESPVDHRHPAVAPAAIVAAPVARQLPVHTAPHTPIAFVVAPHEGLIARLHHDLRTPLNAIIGFADLMQSEVFGPLGSQRYRDYVAHMRSSGEDLLRATETTLAMTALLTRQGGVPAETVPLAALVAEAWTTASSTPKDGAMIEIAIPQELSVRADRAALRQSLVCLFDAAMIRATPASRLEFAAERAGGAIVASLELTASRPAPGVSDSGCRPPTSAAASVGELALCASRTLLSLQNATLYEIGDASDEWKLKLSFEDAAQSDFFEARDKPALRTGVLPAYSEAFFAGAASAGSRSA